MSWKFLATRRISLGQKSRNEMLKMIRTIKSNRSFERCLMLLFWNGAKCNSLSLKIYFWSRASKISFYKKYFVLGFILKVNEERIIGLRRVFLEKRSARRKCKKTSLTLKDDQFATFACYVVVAISSGRNSRKTNSRNIRQTNKPILKAERK